MKNHMPFILHRTHDFVTGPRFQCDNCGKLIDDAHGAYLLWDDDTEGKTKDIIPHVTCFDCDDHDPRRPMSMEIRMALVYLLNSLGMKEKQPKEAYRAAAMLDQIR